LIVQDFINWGKDQGIVFGPGRGSAAGSIIAYALNITDLDPLKYGLLFERFLNPDQKRDNQHNHKYAED
jgi:DNA polymerase-3 subunit alpha